MSAYGSEHEFSDEDNRVLQSVATATRIAGILNIVLTITVIAVAVRIVQVGSVVAGMGLQETGDAVTVALTALFGVWMIRAARHLTAITKTKGTDVRLLMGAFYELTKIYRVQLWVYLIGMMAVAAIIAIAIKIQIGIL